jgi:hypothetical protein
MTTSSLLGLIYGSHGPDVEFTTTHEFSTVQSFSQLPPTPTYMVGPLILFHLSLSSSASTRQIGRGETGGQQAWPWASSPTGGPAVGAPEQASSPARGPTP